MYADSIPIEIQILQDRDIVLTELFPEERLALAWGGLYRERLEQQGWHEAPGGAG